MQFTNALRMISQASLVGGGSVLAGLQGKQVIDSRQN